MITTTANRVKQAGFWCDQADAQTQRMLDAVGADWDTELPIESGLDYLGLANTLLALGAPRARYKNQAERVLIDYATFAFNEATDVGRSLDNPEFTLKTEHRVYLPPNKEQRRRVLTEQWNKKKFNGQTPEERIVADFVIIMLSDLPLQIRLIHGTKTLLSAVQMAFPGEHVGRYKEELRRLLRLHG